MIYFVSAIITFLLSILGISFLPHFWPYLTTPILVLPYLAIISIKDKTIYPYFMALFAGVIYDVATKLTLPLYTLLFIFIILISKFLFSKLTSYSINRAIYILVAIGFIISVSFSYETVINSYQYSSLYILLVTNLFALFIESFLLLHFGGRYFDWIEKETSERFRG